MTNFINLTPHDVHVADCNGNVKTFEKSGVVCRVSSTQKPVRNYEAFIVHANTFGEVLDLPQPQPNTMYIVSAMVLSALNGERNDVVAPNSGKAVRDEKGNILHVDGFVM